MTADQHADSEADRSTPDHPVDQAGPGQDHFGRNGMLVVGFASAVLSFQIWVQLAQAVGFTAHWSIRVLGGVSVSIAWLYPVAIDVYALLVTREWLRSAPGSRLRKWAKTNSVAAIILSYLGQGAFHAFAGHRPPTLFVVLMGGMPPLVVGLTVHMYTMRGRGEGEAPPVKARRVKRATSPAVRVEVVRSAARTLRASEADRNVDDGVVRELRPAVQVGGPVVDRMVAQLSEAYDGFPLDQLPGRRPLMARFGWTSSATASKAIGAYRASREPAQSADRSVGSDDDKEATA